MGDVLSATQRLDIQMISFVIPALPVSSLALFFERSQYLTPCFLHFISTHSVCLNSVVPTSSEAHVSLNDAAIATRFA